jgi:hypothetical protein
MWSAGLADDGGFLDRLKAYGWYLDDLVLEPVNHLTEPQRTAAGLPADGCLAPGPAQYVALV